MASTLAEFEGEWSLLTTDVHGNRIEETLNRRRRRGESAGAEVINLVRHDGVSLRPGTTIVCKEDGSEALSAYMIHEVRLNTGNFVELWCLNYLSWFEVNPTEFYKQCDAAFYENNKEKDAKFFAEAFASQRAKNEIFLTAELSEIYLRNLEFVVNIKNEEEFEQYEQGQTSPEVFLCRFACLPSGDRLTPLDIHAYEEKVRSSKPKDSLKYLHDLTLPTSGKAAQKSRNQAKEREKSRSPQAQKEKLIASNTRQESATASNHKKLLFSNDDDFDTSQYKETRPETYLYSSASDSDDMVDYESANEYEEPASSKKKVRVATQEMGPELQEKQHQTASTSSHSSPRKYFRHNIVRARKAYTPFSKRYKDPKDIPDLSEIFQNENNDLDVAALEDKFRAPSAKGKIETIFSKVKKQLNSRNSKEEIIKAADSEHYLPARENEFANIYLSLYSAIEAGTSTSVYIAGTPGVGKTLTVREVVKDLMISADQKELPKFQYVEINGLKIVKASDSYEVFWRKISGEKLTSGAAMESLEFYFSKVPTTKKRPIVVLLDELDALITKSQDVMYNFFNWATYPNAKLVVVAVANTLDLPERHLGNKISSRIGFTRIMFSGYTHEELKTIINLRLKHLNESSFYVDPNTGSSYMITPDDSKGEIAENEKDKEDKRDFSKFKKVKLRINPDAIEIASRKIASVSGDVRRALKVVKRAVEYAEQDYLKKHGFDSISQLNSRPAKVQNKDEEQEELQTVEITHITRALNESATSPEQHFIGSLSFSAKLFLYALVNLIKKKQDDVQLGDVVEEMKLLIDVNGKNKYILELKRILFQSDSHDTKEQLRVVSWDYILIQLMDAGIVVRQYLKNERLSTIKLNISMEDVENCLQKDEMLKTF